MKFIPISELEVLFQSFGSLRNSDGRQNILSSLRSGSIQYPNHQELIESVAALNEKSLVFYDWIEQEVNLKNLLLLKAPTGPFVGKKRWSEHMLYNDFKQFISPFLCSAALHFRDTRDSKILNNVFSYLCLLPGDEQLVVEQELYKSIKQQIGENIAKAATANTEAALLSIADEVCNDYTTGITGNLSRASYHTRVWFVDQVLSLVQHPACTARLAYRMTQRLKTLDLNPEHAQTIADIEKDLKTGQLLAPKRGIRFFSRFRPASVITVILLAVIGVTVYFVATYRDEPTETKELNTASAFESFSREERIQLDSLLRAQRKDQPTDDVNQDQYLWAQGTGVSLSLRTALKNARMEELYRNWLLNAKLHEQLLTDSCSSNQNIYTERFKGVEDALVRKAAHELVFRNESAYAVYVFVFEEKNAGKVYSHLIGKGKTETLSINTTDHLLFVAGNTLAPFKVPKTVPASECPSSEFTHHFCRTDMNLSVSLSTIYTLKFPSKGRNKLLISGDDQNMFVVADLYGILETI